MELLPIKPEINNELVATSDTTVTTPSADVFEQLLNANLNMATKPEVENKLPLPIVSVDEQKIKDQNLEQQILNAALLYDVQSQAKPIEIKPELTAAEPLTEAKQIIEEKNVFAPALMQQNQMIKSETVEKTAEIATNNAKTETINPQPNVPEYPRYNVSADNDDVLKLKNNLLQSVTPQNNENVMTAQASQSVQLPPQDAGQTVKYENALTQLGHFINEHTMRHAANEQVLTTRPVAASVSDTLNTLRQSEQKADIELLPMSNNPALKDTYSANIKIWPPELGEVLAKLKISKDSAELTIMTENNTVKQIVEANLPQLRENFHLADLNLTSISVQTAPASTKEQSQQNQQAQNGSAQKQQGAPHEESASPQPSQRVQNSIIDTYA